MRLFISILVWIYCVWKVQSENESIETISSINTDAQRNKESLHPPPLVSPYGGTIKFLVGIAVPISITGGRILGFGQNFQFQYAMPQNATFFTNYLEDYNRGSSSIGRRSITLPIVSESTIQHQQQHQQQPKNRHTLGNRDNSRLIFYRSVQLAYERWGGNGKNCLLKSICEAAETPLKDEGLVGELLHVMLTPDYGAKGQNLNAIDGDYVDYLDAARAGKSGNDCSIIYPGCPSGAGLLDKVSTLCYV